MIMAINGIGCRAFDKSQPWVVVFALVLGATTTGCSFLWVTRPVPQEKGSEYPMPLSCTSSYWTPGLDTAAVALLGAATANLVVNPPSTSSGSERAALLSIDGVLAATALASAIYGYHYVAKCRQEKSTTPAAETNCAPRRVYSQPPPPLPSPVVATVPARGKRLAVLEFQGRNLDQDILMTFSDTVRGGTLIGLEPYGVAVMTRENMLVLLRDMGKQECGEGDCEVETARNMGADYLVSGKVVRIEQLYAVTLKLHEPKAAV
jgi:hypothetical protein